jgi:hypothetical protein
MAVAVDRESNSIPPQARADTQSVGALVMNLGYRGLTIVRSLSDSQGTQPILLMTRRRHGLPSQPRASVRIRLVQDSGNRTFMIYKYGCSDARLLLVRP